MYARVTNGIFSGWVELQEEYPNTSFPTPTTAADLPEGIVIVDMRNPPAVGQTQVAEREEAPVFEDGQWRIAYTIRDMTEQELSQLAEGKDEARRAAYQAEADPLFFKWQRGEGTQEAWLAKIAEIKARYPA